MNKQINGNIGERLVFAVENNMVFKDYRPNHGKPFHGGYEDLYLYKFKTYLGSVSRAIINRGLNKGEYNGL